MPETEPPRITFVIPAHDEERLIGESLRALDEAAREIGLPYEVIVVDDASTDRTAAIAAASGATVVRVEHRKIAATRNAGGRAARGDRIFFIDADTYANAAAIRGALRALDAGAVGGGCLFTFDGRVPLWARVVLPACLQIFRWRRLAGGCFLFCTRAAFERVGGFREDYFAGEELLFSHDLKQFGAFVIPPETVVTSGRKLRTIPLRNMLTLLGRYVVRGPRVLRRREGLDVWYGTRQADPDYSRAASSATYGH